MHTVRKVKLGKHSENPRNDDESQIMNPFLQL